jgi:hypothetical protein
MSIQITSAIFVQNALDTNRCPVCGYGMEYPPSDYNICPSCGTEFGVNDVNSTIPDLRKAWLATGPRWWSSVDSIPPDWNPRKQLNNEEESYLRYDYWPTRIPPQTESASSTGTLLSRSQAPLVVGGNSTVLQDFPKALLAT